MCVIPKHLLILSRETLLTLQRRIGRDFKSCQLIASDKSNSLRKAHLLLESGFQVIACFIGPASARSYKIGVLGKIVWLVGW